MAKKSKETAAQKFVPCKGISHYKRTSSDILEITEDKLRLKLDRFEESVTYKADLFCYAGILVALALAITTANFKEWLVGAEVWKAVFIVGFLFIGALFIRGVWLYNRNRMNINDIIREIKDEE